METLFINDNNNEQNSINMASNYDVAHAWAHNRDVAYNGNNMSHRNGRLYSYSTCIGQRLEVNGNIVFLLNNASYSNTTCKHQGYMHGAIPKGDNIYSFSDLRYRRGYCTDIIDTCVWDGDKEAKMKHRYLCFGMKYVVNMFLTVQDIKTCKSLDHGFSYQKWGEFLKWLEVTGCTTVKQILKMKVSDFEKTFGRFYDSYKYTDADWKRDKQLFRKFFKALTENTPVEQLCDLVNGEGEWDAYMKRTDGLRLAKKNRRWTARLYFKTPSTDDYDWCRCEPTMRPVVKGSVTKKDIEKHSKAGDLIQWFQSLHKANVEAAVKDWEVRVTNWRRKNAKKRLEIFLGMTGWEMAWNPSKGKDTRSFTRFNYNGIEISFTGRHHYQQRELGAAEYAEFRKLTGQAKIDWMVAKKQWMLEQLQEDQRRHEQFEAEWAERDRIRKEQEEAYRRQEAEKAEYIAAMKAQGDTGLRQLYHEGFRVSV